MLHCVFTVVGSVRSALAGNPCTFDPSVAATVVFSLSEEFAEEDSDEYTAPCKENPRHTSCNMYPECEPQQCTQSLHPFAPCSSTCTSIRSPKWWEVSWSQDPIPNRMSKSNRAEPGTSQHGYGS